MMLHLFRLHSVLAPQIEIIRMTIRSAQYVGRVLIGNQLELGGPSGKLVRFVSCVRARGAYVR